MWRFYCLGLLGLELLALFRAVGEGGFCLNRPGVGLRGVDCFDIMHKFMFRNSRGVGGRSPPICKSWRNVAVLDEVSLLLFDMIGVPV